MEGIFFYWVAWFFWIVAAFLMKKSSQYRDKLFFCILLTIILIPFNPTIAGNQVNLGLLFLLFVFLLQVNTLRKLTGLYILISSFIVMLAYASFLLFELYDPIWVLFNRNWMVACALVYLCILLNSDKAQRFYTIVIGMIQGEFLYSIIVNKYSFPYPIGATAFLDALAVTLLVLYIWSLCETVTVYVGQQMNQHVRGKQKST